MRQCAKPKQRAAVGLAVRAGSVLEEEHEQGVAHILEHLAFNATEVRGGEPAAAGRPGGSCRSAACSAPAPAQPHPSSPPCPPTQPTPPQNFSNHDIVRLLEGIGAQFGACQNAYTSADETVYQLTVPSDDWATLDKALAVLAEWAFRIRWARARAGRRPPCAPVPAVRSRRVPAPLAARTSERPASLGAAEAAARPPRDAQQALEAPRNARRLP